MALNFKEEELQSQVKSKLNAEKVKLWLPPHTTDEGHKGEVPQVSVSSITHWGSDKMAAISQTTFLNAFSWKKMFAKNGSYFVSASTC